MTRFTDKMEILASKEVVNVNGDGGICGAKTGGGCVIHIVQVCENVLGLVGVMIIPPAKLELKP